jgi:uncharacterized protein YidB (DUF937 family)
MGMLDTIMDELPPEHAATPDIGIPAALSGLLDQGRGGGLLVLAEKFKAAGLGQAFRSWVGNGPNQPVAPQELHDALGADQVQQMAQQTGMSKDEFLPLVAAYLPKIIARLTPEGRLPDPQQNPDRQLNTAQA